MTGSRLREAGTGSASSAGAGECVVAFGHVLGDGADEGGSGIEGGESP